MTQSQAQRTPEKKKLKVANQQGKDWRGKKLKHHHEPPMPEQRQLNGRQKRHDWD
jgi:hypothetical protein